MIIYITQFNYRHGFKICLLAGFYYSITHITFFNDNFIYICLTLYNFNFKDFPMVCDYCERMKNKFWPDWDQCITHGGTREATQ